MDAALVDIVVASGEKIVLMRIGIQTAEQILQFRMIVEEVRQIDIPEMRQCKFLERIYPEGEKTDGVLHRWRPPSCALEPGPSSRHFGSS